MPNHHDTAPIALDDFQQRFNLANCLRAVFLRTWDLGITAFGGPPVHYQIFYNRFVEKYNWIDDQTYKELFAVCQALPGPASTKLEYCICLTYAGFLPALLSFTLWFLPGAIGMYSLALGVSHVSETLPDPVYALLSGVNAATVGVIAVAAVNLSNKTITDQLSRIIIIASGCAALSYSALFYYPFLLLVGGTMTLVWDMRSTFSISDIARKLRVFPVRENRSHLINEGVSEASPLLNERDMDYAGNSTAIHSSLDSDTSQIDAVVHPEILATKLPTHKPSAVLQSPSNFISPSHSKSISSTSFANTYRYTISVQTGVFIVAIFVLSFLVIMLIRGLVPNLLTEFKLFSNLFLAGTIIFGGGPVIVPLLREYIVAEGWVSSRDFLIGLAAIQFFPGPNSNFAIFLSVLTAPSTNSAPLFLAVLGFLGMFMPAMTLATGVSAIWVALRQYKVVLFVLRGVNAAAVGLVWSAVYRLWQVGYLGHGHSSGGSLGNAPCWVVVATIAFSTTKWFNAPPPLSIGLGGFIGLLLYLLSIYTSFSL